MLDLRDTCTSAGVLSSELSTRLGIGHEVPIFRAPAHDTSSAFAAVTDPSDRAAVISCGTWALAGCVLSQPVLTNDAMNAGFTNEMSADGSALLVRNLSGTWLMDECIRAWAKADGLSDITGFRSSLIASAKTEDVNVRGVIDCGHPDLITTTNMPELIGQLYRDRFGTKDLDRVHTVRLILESLAASFAETVEQIRSVTGAPIDELVMIGGGSRIEPLVDLTGKTTSLPVRVSYQEATSIGNIATQAVASGLFESIGSARNFISDNLKESC
jgi:rhamnulokinase